MGYTSKFDGNIKIFDKFLKDNGLAKRPGTFFAIVEIQRACDATMELHQDVKVYYTPAEGKFFLTPFKAEYYPSELSADYQDYSHGLNTDIIEIDGFHNANPKIGKYKVIIRFQEFDKD